MGIERRIKQRELDAIQQNVVVAATKALEAFGPEQCLGMAVEVERPTSADYPASGGYAYIEEIERKWSATRLKLQQG